MQKFYSNGKLLLSGEYVVLDGAKALAIPTKFGQSLTIVPNTSGKLKWKSLDHHGMIWFENTFNIDPSFSSDSPSDNKISHRIVQILQEVKRLNSNFLDDDLGLDVITELEFPINWGLGSSSTLINNVANWGQVDAYTLLDHIFGGSGYDIACAQEAGPLIYQIGSKGRHIEPIHFDPIFKEHLYFVHLNKKRSSEEAIKNYKGVNNDLDLITDINNITIQMVSCKDLHEFRDLMDHHERLISRALNTTPIKESHFKDFEGSIKSLGAWGGDFILVASELNPKGYFSNKGYQTILPYTEMILH